MQDGYTIDIREAIKVNGVEVRLIPYTELRYKQLKRVDKDIDKFVEQNENIRFQDMDKSKKADFWYRKARILWEPKPEIGSNGDPVTLNADYWDKKEKFFTKKFFEDENFEYPLLRKSQNFFLNQEFFL